MIRVGIKSVDCGIMYKVYHDTRDTERNKR